LEIVDHEQERTLRAQIDREPVEAVQQGERRVAGPLIAFIRQLEDGPSRCGRPGQQRPAALDVDERRLVQLAYDPERKLTLQLAAACHEQLEARFGGPLSYLDQQPRLAYAGGALDERKAGFAREYLANELVDGSDLPFAL
jgi:hypothetical protein